LGRTKEPFELIAASAKPDKKVRHIAASAHFLWQPDDPGTGNHLGDPLRTFSPDVIVVEAYIYRGDRVEVSPPFPAKGESATSGGHGGKALAFEDQPIELALADDNLLRFWEHPLPAVQLGPGAGGGDHLGAVRGISRIFTKFESDDLLFAVGDGNGDALAVPA
jgi:hypothetical protein